MNARWPFLLLPFGLLTSCGTPPSRSVTRVPEHPVAEAASAPDTMDVKSLAVTILQGLKNRDYDALSGYIHPLKGVLFSPYGFVDTADVVRLSEADFKYRLTRDTNRKIGWGSYDGSGDSIFLTPPAYVHRFVYDRDFAASASLLVNEMRQRGNSLNNLNDVFPEADVVETYDAGTTELDWRILRLVFEKYQDRYYLVAIVHDEWTI